MPVWIVTHGWRTGIAFRLADLPARAAPVRRYRKRTETGQFDLVPVPYLFKLDGGAVARVRVDDRSILSVRRDAPGGPFTLCRGDEGRCTTEFVRAHAWQGLRTTDGAKPFAAGVEHLDDMLVVNLAPGCEYFRVRDELGGSLRCSFCAYGRFDGRAVAMGQEPGRRPSSPDAPAPRRDSLTRDGARRGRHVSITGGSVLDPADETRRYLPIIETARRAVGDRLRVTCGPAE